MCRCPQFIIFPLLVVLYSNSLFAQAQHDKKTIKVNVIGKVLDDSLIYFEKNIHLHIDSPGDRFKKVDFTGTKFLNYTDFAGDTISGKANFPFAFFKDTTNFSGATFQGEAIFLFAAFNGITSFSSAKFLKAAEFRHVIFNNTTDFIKTTFAGRAIFNGRFEKQLHLDSSKFLDTVSFFRSRFGGSAYFENDTFKNAVYFQIDTVQKDLSFWRSEFKNGINFLRSIFQKKVDFEEADIQKELILSNVSTSDSTKFYFDYAKLPDLISFANISNVHGEIDLTAANFSRSKLYSASERRWHYINLFDSDIPKIKIDYEHFKLCFFSGTNGIDNEDIAMSHIIKDIDDDTIGINNKKFARSDPKLFDTLLKVDAFRDYLTQVFPTAKVTDTVVKDFVDYCLAWGNFPQALSKDEVLSTYEKVLKNFELNGQMESYKALDIEYRDFENDGWFNINHIWNRYGYNKEWIFYWTAGFLLLFTLITSFFIGDFNQKIENNGVYYLENITLDHPGEKFFILKRFIHAFVYTSSVFFLLGLKIENLNFRRSAVIYILLVYSMGILCLGYVANFVLAK